MKIIYCIFIAFLLVAMQSHGQSYNRIYPVFRTQHNGLYTSQKHGYMSADNKLLIDYIYDDGDFFNYGYAKVRKDNKSGLIDTTGKWVLPPIFEYINVWRTEPMWTCKIYPDSLTVYGQGGKVICQGYGDGVTHFKEIDRIILNTDMAGKHGVNTTLFDYEGHKLSEFAAPNGQSLRLNAIDQDGIEHKNRKALQLTRGNLPGAITDMQGHILIDSVGGGGFYRGYMIVAGPGKAAVIDTDLREIIPFSAGYKSILRLEHTPYFYVRKDGLWGVIDTAMHVVIDFRLSDRFWQSNADNFIIYDSKNKLYICYNYKGDTSFVSQAPVQIGYRENKFPIPLKLPGNVYRLWKGNYISKPHEFISQFNNEGFAYCYDNEARSIIDTTGKIIFTTTLPFLTLPQNGIMGAGIKMPCPSCDGYKCALQVVGAEGSYAQLHFYINLKGERLCIDTFERISPFINGQAEVTKNCKHYFINEKGKKLTSASSYIIMTAQVAGVSVVENNIKQQALMNNSGKIISPWVSSFRRKEGRPVSFLFFDKDREEFNGGSTEMLPDFQNGLLIFQEDNKYGLMDSMGHIATPAIYSGIGWDNDSHYKVYEINKREGILNREGKQLIPAIYSHIIYYYEPKAFILEKNEGGMPEVFTDKN